MNDLSKEEAFSLGQKANKKGLPLVPLMDEEFVEKNQHTPGLRWSDNIKEYIRGYHRDNRRRDV